MSDDEHFPLGLEDLRHNVLRLNHPEEIARSRSHFVIRAALTAIGNGRVVLPREHTAVLSYESTVVADMDWKDSPWSGAPIVGLVHNPTMACAAKVAFGLLRITLAHRLLYRGYPGWAQWVAGSGPSFGAGTAEAAAWPRGVEPPA